MKTKLLSIATRVHLMALLLAVLNLTFKKWIGVSLINAIEIGMHLFIGISGFVLCFFYLKPLRQGTAYFSLYGVAGIFLVIGLLFRGVFGALVLSIILAPVIPNDTQFQRNEYTLSIPFKGFMAPCCYYQIKQRHLWVLEKDYGIFQSQGPIDFETVELKLSSSEIVIVYETDFEMGVQQQKTVKR